MATERLIVKSFGPIQEADLDLRKVTVLIGEQASGKSVLAKLLSILRDPEILQEEQPEKDVVSISSSDFEERLKFYAIEEFFSEISYIWYECEDYTLEIDWDLTVLTFKNTELRLIVQQIIGVEKEDKSLERKGNKAFREKEFEKSASIIAERKVTHTKLVESRKEFLKITFEIEYIPAERALVAVGESLLFDDNHYLQDFYDNFLKRRRLAKKFHIRPINMEFGYDTRRKENIITLHGGVSHRFSTASNGVQSLTPLIVSVETTTPIHKHLLIIIEEPELNLYPTTQKKLVEYLVEKCTKGDNRLIITTHSPYILTALNNCIQAKNVVDLHPEAAEEVDKLVPSQYRIDYQDVMAYYVGGGTAKSIMNEDFQMIDANALDDVSNELGAVFDKLLDLKYQDQD